MTFLGIDLGTSGSRVGLYDEAGTEIRSASSPTTIRRPTAGRAQIDGDAVLGAVEGSVRELMGRDPAAPLPDAISFATLGEAVVPVGRDGLAVGPAPLSMDMRGAEVAERMSHVVGADRVQRITGQPLHPMFSVYKLGLLGQGHEDRRVSGVRTLDDYVATRWGAAPAIDRTMAARTGAYDVGTGEWSAEVLDALGVRRETFSPVVTPGTVTGALSDEAAARLGLRAGTPIVAGAHDQAAAFLGGGGQVEAVAVVSFGSSECYTVATPARPRRLIGTGLATYPLAPGFWITLAGTAAGGWALDWYSQLVGEGRAVPGASLFDIADVAPPRLLVLPHLAGSGTLDNDPEARGSILGLTLETRREQIARAFVEASGFELAKVRRSLADRGIEPPAVHAVGGGSVHPGVLQARADASGTTLHAVVRESAGRGAALLAGVGVGAHTSLRELPAPPVDTICRPASEHSRWYAVQRSTFDSLHSLLRPVNTALAADVPAVTFHEEMS